HHRGLRQNGSAQGRKPQEYVRISRFPDEAMDHFASNPKDAQMASISRQSDLGRATSPPGGPFGPSCSPFGRLDGAIYAFTP
ncbi:hypothetical protein, partial [Novosphingobium lindaniclasticum]|uniref:hypothetical protein n=1 Tax=Novosphingobium lindaniclasticum TaxID=1329895 RepID=UPI001F3889FD